jgi:hypothetical protein
VVIACLVALAPVASARAQEDVFVSPPEGAAGSRFQVVGETGWVPGEAVTLRFAFADVAPGEAFAGPFFRTETVTVLRDGSWSFPVVVNNALVPFPLWRPGYIVIEAVGSSQTSITTFTYLVEEHRPVGEPPLADLGFGPHVGSRNAGGHTTIALFALAIGGLLVFVGSTRREPAG